MKRVIVAKPLKPMLRLCQIVALIAIVGGAARAQETYAPITAANAGRITQIERIGSGVPRALAFAPNGLRLAAATTLGVWVIHLPPLTSPPMPAGTEETNTLLEGQGGAESVVFSTNGARIAAGGDDGSVMLWSTAGEEMVKRLENHLYPVTALTWSNNLLASGDQSGIVRLWNTMTWSEMRVFQMKDPIRQLLYHTAATQLTVFSGTQAITWDIAGSVLYQTGATPDLGYAPNASRGERQAIYSARTGQIEVWDKSERLIAFDGFYGELGSIFFSDDGRVQAREIAPEYVWSLETGEIAPQSLDPPSVTSPAGSRIAQFGNDGVIHLLDAATKQEIAALHGHIRAINAVAFSPDGRLLASASNDGTIGIWDATVSEDSAPLAILSGHASGVTDVAFNATGTRLASAGYDGTVRLWGIAN